MKNILILSIIIVIAFSAKSWTNENNSGDAFHFSGVDSVTAIPAQGQLDAYNSRDIDKFLSWYADSIQLIRMQSGEVFCSGKEQMREIYGNLFSEKENLHCRLVNRIVCGDFVFDEEKVTGLRGDTVHAVAIYEIKDGLIQRAWFVSGR
jgi:hypothetical protein